MKKRVAMILIFTRTAYATVSTGPYIGIELGTDNQIITYQPSAYGINTNGSQLYNANYGFMGRLNFGYAFDRYNSIEIGPSYYFSQNYNFPAGNGTMGVSATSLDFSYLPSLPISQSKLSVFGRLGFAYDWINSDVSSCNCNNFNNQVLSGSNFADVIGAGLKYNFSVHSSMRVEWIANGLFFPVGIGNGGVNAANWSTQQFLAGINYHF